jgi:hypothetical protein
MGILEHDGIISTARLKEILERCQLLSRCACIPAMQKIDAESNRHRPEQQTDLV